MMDDGYHFPSSDENGHDIGPDEERLHLISQEHSHRPVELIRSYHGGDVNVEYETVYVERPQFLEPLDYGPPEELALERTDPLSFSHNVNKLFMETVRLSTFKNNWLSSYPVQPAELARNGFAYHGPGDKVKCVFCQKTVYGWEPADRVEGEHRRLYPNCPFVLGKCDHLNKPISPTDQMRRSLGVKVRGDCSFPDMKELSERLKTFETWPLTYTLSATRLAEAGLFYTGVQDIVKCFQCGKLLQKWEAGDDPMEEHRRNYPDCSYIRNKFRQANGALTSGRDEHSSEFNHIKDELKSNVNASESEKIPGIYAQPEAIRAPHCQAMPSAQDTEQHHPHSLSASDDLNSPAAQAVQSMCDISEEELISIFRALRLSKGPMHKISAPEILEYYEREK